MPSFRRTVLPAVLIVLTGVLLAGCAEPIRGTAVANKADIARYRAEQQRMAREEAERKADEAELTSEEALGEIPALDLCSLAPRDDFGAGAKVSGSRRPSFNTCSLTLTTAKTKAQLDIGPVEDGKSSTLTHRPYDKHAPAMLKVLADEPSPDNCSLYLQFPDDVRVRVDTNTYLQGGKLAKGNSGFLCRASAAAINQMINTVTTGAVEHWNLPPSSFGTANTCTAINASVLDKQLGKGVSKRRLEFPSGQHCEWGTPGAAPRAVFRTDIAEPGKDGKKQKINGRLTYVAPSKVGKLRYCYLETAGNPFPKAGKKARELAALYVVLNPGKRKPCAVATALAETAWRSLPD